MTTIFVVTADAVSDVAGEMMCGGGVIAAFSTEEAAKEFISNIKETYLRSRSDYTVTEVELDRP